MAARRKTPAKTVSETVRRALQQSTESSTALAQRYGLNPKTVAKWRIRNDAADLLRGRPKAQTSTVLTRYEEAIAIAFRRSTMLSLDDCVHALQLRIPQVNRYNLYRCFKRHGLGRIEAAAGPEPGAHIGTWNVEVCELAGARRHHIAIVAIDARSRLLFGEVYALTYQQALERLVSDLSDAAPYAAERLIIRGLQQPLNESALRRHLAREGRLRLAKPAQVTVVDTPWPTPVEGAAAAGDALPVETHRRHIVQFAARYNFYKRLKSIGGRTPIEFVNRAWAETPEQFWRKPAHLTAVFAAPFHNSASGSKTPMRF